MNVKNLKEWETTPYLQTCSKANEVSYEHFISLGGTKNERCRKVKQVKEGKTYFTYHVLEW